MNANVIRIMDALIFWVISSIGIAFLPMNLLYKLGILVALIGGTFPILTVFVPEVTGLVLVNFFTGELRTVGTGLNFKWPWEMAREKNFFSLELVTKEVKEKTFAAKDGPLMQVKALFQYYTDIRLLHQRIKVDESTIEEGVNGVISGLISYAIGNENAEDARLKIKEIEKTVIDELKMPSVEVHKQLISPKENMENRNGINFVLLTIEDIDFPEDYQEIRSAAARMEKLSQMTKDFKNQFTDPVTKQSGITDKEALNAALVEQQKAKKNIFEVEGSLASTVGGMIIKKFIPGDE